MSRYVYSVQLVHYQRALHKKEQQEWKLNVCSSASAWTKTQPTTFDKILIYNNISFFHRILHDQSSASGIHSQTLDTMRQKLGEMEGTLAREQQAHKSYQQEASERQSRLEQEQKTLADSLTAAEKKITEEKGICKKKFKDENVARNQKTSY